jgi:tetratricopeptide (TPR) repeat protein
MRNISFYLTIISACALLVSCDKFSSGERNHPLFLAAKKARNQSRYDEAAETFEKYLLIDPKSARAHNELGTLYDLHLDSPLLAIYHYRQYLKYAPESQDAETISKWLEAAEKKYYIKMKEKYEDKESYEKIQAELTELRKKNELYKDYIIKVRKKLIPTEKKEDSQTPKPKITTPTKIATPKLVTVDKSKIPPPVSAEKTVAPPQENKKQEEKKPYPVYYVVQGGDNLLKISKKFYGTSKYYKLIYKANSNILPSESRLTVGQKLIIPDLSLNQGEQQ